METRLEKNDPKLARQYFADKMAFTTGPVELERALKNQNDIAVIDVRAAEDFEKEHIPGSINLPQTDWSTFKGLRRDGLNVLVCYSHVCHLAATAAVRFAGEGYSVMELDGGFEGWKENDLDVEKKSFFERKKETAMA